MQEYLRAQTRSVPLLRLHPTVLREVFVQVVLDRGQEVLQALVLQEELLQVRLLQVVELDRLMLLHVQAVFQQVL